MKFRISNQNIYLVLILICTFLTEPLTANADIKDKSTSIIDLFYQDSGITSCDKKGQTVYDKNFISEKLHFTNKKDKCQLAKNVCDVMLLEYISSEIQNELIQIAAIYDSVKPIIEDPRANQRTQTDYRLYLKNRIYIFLTKRDAIGDDELFNKIFDEEIENFAAHPPLQMSFFLENDRTMLDNLASLVNFYPEIPYGENVCRENQSTSDQKAASKCFITQDGFINSVKTDRENERNAWDKLGKKNTITHLIRQESVKPCGAVTGAWAANANGRIIFNTLKVLTPEGEKMLFDQTILSKLVRKIDQELSLKNQ